MLTLLRSIQDERSESRSRSPGASTTTAANEDLDSDLESESVVPEVGNAGTENAVTSTVSSPTRQLVNDDLESAARAATRELSQGTPPSPKRIAERLSRAENPELRI